MNWEAIIAATIKGMLKAIKVGTQVSQMWSCCPSAFRPEVGPRVVSEAGDPASPSAAAADISRMVAAGENPIWEQRCTYSVARTGMVPKEVA